MSHQHDWVGTPTVTPPQFRDIGNQRASTAEGKAVLLLELGGLLNHIPHKVRSASINSTRQWVALRAEVAKVAKNQRSSVGQIRAAINTMRSWGE